jgi:hypothetical protein
MAVGRPFKRARTWEQDECEVFILAGGRMEYPDDWNTTPNGEWVVCALCRRFIETYLAVGQAAEVAQAADAAAQEATVAAAQAQMEKQQAYAELHLAWARQKQAKATWAKMWTRAGQD